MTYLVQQGAFVFCNKHVPELLTLIRRFGYGFLGMKIGKQTVLPKFYITWPHQVFIGYGCSLEHGIYFKYDGVWKPGPSIIISDRVFIGAGCEFNIRKKIVIGSDTLIASGCRFIDHDHGIKLGQTMGSQPGIESAIEIGNDVWLGCNVVVLKGVVIGPGAIVAAGAVVTKSILSNEIWGGVPARKIGERKY